MIVKKLVELGGKEWIKNTMHRVYFNQSALVNLFGLKCSYYKTGNICAAMVNGSYISNNKANEILFDLSGKFFYDVNENRFCTPNSSSACNECVGILRNALNLIK